VPAAESVAEHDTQETRITDLPHLTKRYVAVASNDTVTAGRVQRLPAARR
jgi:putative hydrolase of HD superfamily